MESFFDFRRIMSVAILLFFLPAGIYVPEMELYPFFEIHPENQLVCSTPTEIVGRNGNEIYGRYEKRVRIFDLIMDREAFILIPLLFLMILIPCKGKEILRFMTVWYIHRQDGRKRKKCDLIHAV